MKNANAGAILTVWETATGKMIRTFKDARVLESDSEETLWGIREKWLVQFDKDKTADNRQNVALWDLTTDRKSHAFTIPGVPAAFTLSQDGTRFVTTQDNKIQMWDTTGGKPIRLFQGRVDLLSAAVVSGNGQRLATSGGDCIFGRDVSVRLWDLTSGRQVRAFNGKADSHSAVAMTHDGKRLITTIDKKVHLWDSDLGKKIRSFPRHKDSIYGVALSPDGKSLATAGRDGSARVWELDTGKQTKIFKTGQRVLCVQFSHDGKWLVTGNDRREAVVWNLASGKEIDTVTTVQSHVNSVALSRDAKILITGSGHHIPGNGGAPELWKMDFDDDSFLWELYLNVTRISLIAERESIRSSLVLSLPPWLEMARSVLQFRGDDWYAPLLAVRPDPTNADAISISLPLTSMLRLKTVCVAARKNQAGVSRPSPLPDIKEPVRAMPAVEAPPPMAEFVPAPTKRDPLPAPTRLVEPPSPRPVYTVTYMWTDNELERIAKRLTSSQNVFRKISFEMESKKPVIDSATNSHRIFERPDSGGVDSVALSADGKWLVSSSQFENAVLWNAETGKQVRAFVCDSNLGQAVSLCHDDRRLVTAGLDGITRIWDLASGKELCRLISFRDGTWCVFDAAGRFDAANQGSIDALHWTVGMQTFPLRQFRDRFYDPGLLAKHLGFNREPLRNVDDRE
jgi:WD40 repeat protein